MLTEAELITIRRHLHQIPELALHEFATHKYLEETIANFNQEFLEVQTPEELPTALMVLVHGHHQTEPVCFRNICLHPER
ncbi:hypothetical protein [uncultured Limosilactobacillus sp.]|uniref:hypothetical protein n=1 Tax=uncultured Limosilactobacillus sp. TaxID=2837629 RepID=UPI00351DA686